MNKVLTPTVFVVDDDASLRDAIRNLLHSVGHAVETFVSVEDFQARRNCNQPGCLVLDVRLPGISGLEFQKHLIFGGDPIPTVFITGHGDIPMSVQAMKAGAVEFLSKPFRDQDLLDAIQSALNRDHEQREADQRMASVLGNYNTLTAREREVMGLVVKGQINKQIAAAANLSEVTVKIHRSQVMRKMNATSLPDLVRMADRLENMRRKR